MRTTLQLEDDVFIHAKQLAVAQGKPLGVVVSALMRQGIQRSQPKPRKPGGFPVFDVAPGGKTVTLEDVKRAEEEDDEYHAGRV